MTIVIKVSIEAKLFKRYQTASSDLKLLQTFRENNELLETVNKQRSMLEDVRKREVDAFIQVKKSCELAEEVQLQKQEVRFKIILHVTISCNTF